MTNYLKAILVGFLGTAAMTLLIFMAPLMGMPKMDIGGMLAGFMGLPLAVGWVMHFMLGIILALIYAIVAKEKPTLAKAMLFSVAPWLVMMVALLPMMGLPLFKGSILFGMGALLGHLVYGLVVGLVYKTA